jgi:hypothetical protein
MIRENLGLEGAVLCVDGASHGAERNEQPERGKAIPDDDLS